MAVTADVFQVLFKAETGELKRGVADATGVLRSFGAEARSLASLGSFGGPFARLAAGIGGLLGVGGLVGLAVQAARSAAQFDVLTRSLATVTGSMDRAREVMDFSERLAGPSAFFDTEQLARAATLLATLGVEVERFLPVASTMASLIGQNEESLTMFASALGRIRAGQFGEGFEAMRRFGIGRTDLEAFGARFDRSGQFLGTPEEALSAIERVVRTRFGELDRVMQASPMARFTSLLDAAARALRRVGEGVLQAAMPAIDAATKALSSLVDSGAVRAIGDAVARLFDPAKVTAWANSILAGLMTMAEVAPKAVRSLGSALAEFGRFVRTAATVYLSFVAAAFGSRVVSAIMATVRAFAALRAAIAGAAGAGAVLQGLTGVGLASALAGLAAGAVVYFGLKRMVGGATERIAGVPLDDLAGMYRANLARLSSAEPAGDEPAPSGAAPANAVPALIGEQTQVLRRIERNTERQVELQRMLLGGGELARAVLASQRFWASRRGDPTVWYPGGA